MLNKIFPIIIFLFAFTIVVSGCTISFFQNKLFKSNEKPKEKATTTEVANEATSSEQTLPATSIEKNFSVWPEQNYTENDYEGWKVYVNRELGYQIKYPPDWTISSCDEDCSNKEVIINPPNAEMFTSYISIGLDSRIIKSIKNIYLDLDNKLRSIDGGYKPYSEEEIIFSGKKALRFYNGDIKNAENIILLYNGKILNINTQKYNIPKVPQSLASFKLID